MTVQITEITFGKSGNDKANHTAETHPAKACPGKPTLKKPALDATENPSAIRISGLMARRISPIFFNDPKAVVKRS